MFLKKNKKAVLNSVQRIVIKNLKIQYGFLQRKLLVRKMGRFVLYY